MRDLFNNAVVKRAISPVSVSDNTVQTSQIIDTRGFDGVMFVIAAGSLADSDATFTVDAKENDTNSTTGATDVASDNLIGTEAGASFQFDSDDQVRKILIRPTKRYCYITITPAGNASAALLTAIALQLNPTYRPVTQPTA